MQNGNTHYKASLPVLFIVLALSCVLPVARAAAGPSVVGLWHVFYSEDGSPYFESFDQWHSDGLEYEVANAFGLSCQGVYKQRGDTVELFHTGWNYDSTGALVGYFNETQTNVVARGGNTYNGTWDIKNYDLDGNFVSEDSGTLTATRLTVDTPP